MKQKLLSVAGGAGAAAAMVIVGLLAVASSAYAIVPTFSQSSVTVGLGQSVTVVAQNTSVYMLSNSSPTTATVSVNGSQVAITGAGLGSSQIALCGVGTASDCTNLNVTVQSGAVTGLSFSQNNLALTAGANQTVTISGGNGTYTVSSNSNTAAASANLSGSLLTVNAIAAGGASINLCDTASNCAALSVTVNAANAGSGAGAVVFGAANPTVAAGQTVNVSLSNGSSYYISSNTNSSIATALISGGTTLAVTGVSAGSDSFTVCSGNGTGCGTISVTVSGTTTGSTTSGSTGATGNAYVNFSIASPTVSAGQTVNVTLTPGYQTGGSVTGYVVLTNQTASVASANINGTTVLSIGGLAAGTDMIAVCAQGSGCNSITVTVTGTATTPAPVITTPVTTPTAPAPTTGANSSVVAAIQSLQSTMAQLVSQIQSLQSQLSQILIQSSAAGSGSAAGSSVGSSVGTSSNGSYYFVEYLALGSQDAEVTALQNQLAKLGFFSGAATGYYGTQTETAVKAYQAAHGLSAVGYVGPSTRAALNAGN